VEAVFSRTFLTCRKLASIKRDVIESCLTAESVFTIRNPATKTSFGPRERRFEACDNARRCHAFPPQMRTFSGHFSPFASHHREYNMALPPINGDLFPHWLTCVANTRWARFGPTAFFTKSVHRLKLHSLTQDIVLHPAHSFPHVSLVFNNSLRPYF
jgi:hypothetical protein